MPRIGFTKGEEKPAVPELKRKRNRRPRTEPLDPALHDANGKFTKGHEKRGGRRPGVKNLLDKDTKELMDLLVLHGLRKATQLFDRSAKRSPSRALNVLAKFAEYRLPKLARTELTGPDGGPQVIEKRIYVTPSTPSEADAVAAQLAQPHKE